MIILDTDHVSVLQRSGSERAEHLRRRLKESGEPVRITVVTYEEQMRAWLALIARERTTERQVQHYASLIRFTAFYRTWIWWTLTRPLLRSLIVYEKREYESQQWIWR